MWNSPLGVCQNRNGFDILLGEHELPDETGLETWKGAVEMEDSFKHTELGCIKTLLPLREMAISFGLKEEHPNRLRVKRGRKPFFTPEGKVALAFLKSYTYTGLSAPKLMDALNANIHYQIYYGIRIRPDYPMTN